MRVVYDSKTDILTIILRETPIVESDEDRSQALFWTTMLR